MFLDNIEELARKKNVSLTAVANACDLSNNAATKWRNGAVPNSKNLKKIADYFGVSVEYLLRDNENQNAMNGSSINNSAIIQGNTGNNVSATVGAVAAKEQPADESELEILRIYRSLNVLEKARFIQMAFEFDGKEK